MRGNRKSEDIFSLSDAGSMRNKYNKTLYGKYAENIKI